MTTTAFPWLDDPTAVRCVEINGANASRVLRDGVVHWVGASWQVSMVDGLVWRFTLYCEELRSLLEPEVFSFEADPDLVKVNALVDCLAWLALRAVSHDDAVEDVSSGGGCQGRS